MNITKDYFHDKEVLIFGLGTNGGGLGTLSFLLETPVKRIIVTDQKSEGELLKAGIKLPVDDRIDWRLGEHRESDFKCVKIVIKNPSIPWTHPMVVLAEQNGAEVIMDSTIFMALCPAPVIGITGSKGKTSTASLIAHILEGAGLPVVQVGISQTGVLSELSKVNADSVVVFELSSWRLSGLSSIAKSPFISVITNLYPDHLNYYPNMELYAEDKRIITDFQSENDFLILPDESEWSAFFEKDTKAKVQKFGTKTSSDVWQNLEILAYWEENNKKEPAVLITKKETPFKGNHFFNNMLAASLAARSFGVNWSVIRQGLLTFRGVPHRFEFVREFEGITYINDTTATIPSASLASVESICTPVILLAGGSDKGLPLDELFLAIEKSKSVILFVGSGTDKILASLNKDLRSKIAIATSMDEAVQKAKKSALKGDTVLLAPGAASFGMFLNEFDRGEQFIKMVTRLS